MFVSIRQNQYNLKLDNVHNNMNEDKTEHSDAEDEKQNKHKSQRLTLQQHA